MRVILDSDHAVSVELESGKLWVNLTDQKKAVLLENAQQFSVTKAGKEIHITSLDDSGQMWHFWGKDTYTTDKLSDGDGRVKGSLLAADGSGNVHLIYLTEPVKVQGASLKHRVFSKKWSNPMLVSTHVLPDNWGYTLSWDSEGFLHLAYLSYGDGHLMYRVFDAEKNHWSGAVPLVARPSLKPQFFPGRSLVLAWIIEEETGQVQLMQKNQQWSRIQTISQGPEHCSGVGFGKADSNEYIVWRQGEKLWRMPLGTDNAQPESVDMTAYSFLLRVIEGENGAVMVPFYTWTSAESEEPEPALQTEVAPEESVPAEPKSVEPSPEEQQREVERQLQSAFIEQAFKLQMEWESLRSDYTNVREELRRLEDKMEVHRLALTERLEAIPRPKVEPLMQRVERLEIRLTKYERELQSWQNGFESRISRLEQASLALNRRVGNLENPEPEKRRSLWKRLWWR